jgi:hypothetical protein
LADDDALADVGAELAAAIVEALPRWSVRVVVARGGPADRAEAAGHAAADALAPTLRALLAADVDAQRANPLAIVRTAVRWPTEVLRDAGVAPVARDDYAQAHFPDDVYDLTPMTWADVDESLPELGIRWGATKAHVHLQRHR